MEKSDLLVVIAQLETATDRLEKVLLEDAGKNDAFVDASVQRFEFCFELCWKTLKRCLQFENLSPQTPREVLKEAFRLGWLTEGDQFWVDMVEDRNLTSHTYNLKTAMKVYGDLPGYLAAYRRLTNFLRARYQ